MGDRTSDYDYYLPPERIAQSAAEPRDHARLLVIDRATGDLQHRHFFDLPDLLRPGDVLIANQSRVIPARLFARKPTGGRVELLLLHRTDGDAWAALLKPGRRLAPGAVLTIEKPGAAPVTRGEVHLLERGEDGLWTVRLSDETSLDEAGIIPLPPYIKQQPADPERYQTVYARDPGSAAAPTAGLHFTPELIARLEARGHRFGFVVLHVGLDTFRPVEVDDPADHRIHSEWCSLPPETASLINQTRAAGGRIVAIGTTTVRVLETAGREAPVGERIRPYTGPTQLYIRPGFGFRVVDALITNFHLPRSSLLFLVSALAGRERILSAYRTAIDAGYRFYSFGDAMLIT